MSLRERLESVPLDRSAEERAWRVTRAAFAEREPARRPRARPKLVLALAALAVAAAAASPPGRAVLGSLRDAVVPARQQGAADSLRSLPAAGRLLVNAPTGAWVVQRDGSKRRLGPYRDASWSPRGLYVVAAAARQLVALDPKGNVRWTRAADAAVRLPSWSPSGRVEGDTRIAYLVGATARVVGGDGRGDRLLVRGAAPVQPAWRPGPDHAVAVAERRGVSLWAVDRARRLWRARLREAPRGLAWSSDGALLLVRLRTELRIYRADGSLLTAQLGAGAAPVVAAAWRPGRHALAFVQRAAGRSDVWIYPRIRPDATVAHRLFAGAGAISDVAWSPDARWLLVGWQTANQWLFLRSTPARRVLADSNIAGTFQPSDTRPADFPRLGGWCCVSSPPSRG